MTTEGLIHENNLTRQTDEIEALSSIYGTDFHTESSETNTFSIEINEALAAALEVTLPPEYPTLAPPSFLLSAPWLKGPKRQILSGYLEDIYLENIGESVIYLWVERIREFIVECQIENERKDSSITEEETLVEEVSGLRLTVGQPEHHDGDEEDCPEIFSGEIISDRKSHFQPHLAAVHSIAQVKRVLRELNENKKIAAATHNMYAYRFTPPVQVKKKDPSSPASSIVVQDCDDDGEANAGGRMLHLLQILNAEDVLVVVSRWYGGIKLGSDRFKHINNAARNILSSCGYVKEKEEKGGVKKNKKK